MASIACQQRGVDDLGAHPDCVELAVNNGVDLHQQDRASGQGEGQFKEAATKTDALNGAAHHAFTRHGDLGPPGHFIASMIALFDTQWLCSLH